MFETLPRTTDALPMIPGMVATENGVSICQHSMVDAPLEAPMAVMFKFSAVAAKAEMTM